MNIIDDYLGWVNLLSSNGFEKGRKEYIYVHKKHKLYCALGTITPHHNWVNHIWKQGKDGKNVHSKEQFDEEFKKQTN